MTTPRLLVAALFAASMSLFAAPAIGQGYGDFGVFGSPNGTFQEGDNIPVQFIAVNLDCDSWTVLFDETGEAPGGGGGGSTFTFSVSPNAGTYSITAQCNESNTAAPAQAGVTQVEPAGLVQGAGETQDTITFTVLGEDDDDDDDDGDGRDRDRDRDDDDDKGGGLPDTGGENRGLLLLGGGLTLAGAALVISRRRREA